MPNSKGCDIVYHLLVVRVFKSFEHKIDHAADKVTEYTKELVNIGTGYIEKTTTAVNAAKTITNATAAIKADDSPTKSPPQTANKPKPKEKLQTKTTKKIY